MKMIKSFISAIIILSLTVLTGCSFKQDEVVNEPQLSQVRSICELAVLECYYHNVAKSVKHKKWRLQADRDFWIEYSGIAKIGIDMSEVKMSIDTEDPTVIYITIPDAKLLGTDIDVKTLDEKRSVIATPDRKIKNKITADDQTEAIKKAQIKMEETVENDSAVLIMAQERAKKLIENYITQLGKSCGRNYSIIWTDTNASQTTGSTAAETTPNE